MTERNAVSGLERGLKHYNIDVKAGQLIYVFPKKKSKAFVDLDRAITAFGKQSKAAALQGNKDTTQGKEFYTFFSSIISSLKDFSGTDYVTKEVVKIGNVGELEESDILVIDGLSPITHEIWQATVGDKIQISMSDYMAPQYTLYKVFADLGSLECSVILLAHEKDMTDDKGTILSTLIDTGVGHANYAKLMGCFTDVIHAYKFGSLYKWEGEKAKVGCISRVIPKETNLEPNFSLYNFFGNKGSYKEKTK